jgi:hypothetical protein
MPHDKQDLMLQLAISTHDLGTAITSLQVRLTQVVVTSERNSILLALPRLKTDQRSLEATLAAMAADTDTVPLPSDGQFTALEGAADQLSAATARLQSAEVVVAAATDLVNAVRSITPS